MIEQVLEYQCDACGARESIRSLMKLGSEVRKPSLNDTPRWSWIGDRIFCPRHSISSEVYVTTDGKTQRLSLDR